MIRVIKNIKDKPVNFIVPDDTVLDILQDAWYRIVEALSRINCYKYNERNDEGK